MKGVRQLPQMIDRCVSAMARYHDGDRTSSSARSMIAEVESLAAWSAEHPWTFALDAGEILGPVEVELLARYGPESGPRLSGVFAGAFGEAAGRIGRPGRPIEPDGGPAGAKPRRGGADSAGGPDVVARALSLGDPLAKFGGVLERDRGGLRRAEDLVILAEANAELDSILRAHRRDRDAPGGG